MAVSLCKPVYLFISNEIFLREGRANLAVFLFLREGKANLAAFLFLREGSANLAAFCTSFMKKLRSRWSLPHI